MSGASPATPSCAAKRSVGPLEPSASDRDRSASPTCVQRSGNHGYADHRGFRLPEDRRRPDFALAPRPLTALGTDGFGRSENREHLRRHFEVDAASIAAAALSRLASWKRFDVQKATQAIVDLGLDPNKIDAAIA